MSSNVTYDVFLSYARADDEPFVKRLYSALTKAGFTVWWDRVCMPSRALTFLEEIRKAIHESSRLVIVIGPKAVSSDYCRAEWQYALVDNKIVTPILRFGKYELLPPELESLHCPDFQTTRKFNDALHELTRILREPLPVLGHLYGVVPTPPPRFQPRPDDMTRLADTVLIDRKKPITLTDAERTTVLHGISGVGKSVLAASFTRATTTRRAFSDGIFWLAVGENAEPLPLLRQLGQFFGAGLELIPDIATGVNQLREHLDEKRCLLVLDNVWHVEQIEPFLEIIGANDRILLTSRSSELTTATGGREILLDSLSEEAALRQLSDWTGQAIDELPTEARELAQECGYLPFALALNGAMAADGNRWSDLLDALRSGELDFAEKRFADYPFPNVLKSVALSVDVLARNEPESARRYRELAVYLAKDGVSVAAIALLWNYQGGLKERDTRKLVAKLANKGLLRLEVRWDEQYVVLHDLQYDFLRATTRDLDGLNNVLLKVYQDNSPDDWPSGPNDGYFHSHLIEHLLVAKRPDEVHRLISLETTEGRNAWYEATEAIGGMQGYLNDLGHAWELVVASYDESVASDSLDNVGLGIKYTLMLASLNSLTSNVPITLIDALINANMWTFPRALAYARAIHETSERVQALVALVHRSPEPIRSVILREAIAITVIEHDDSLNSWLAENLAESGLINESLGLARAINENQTRAITLGAIMDYLLEEDRPRVLKEAVSAAFATGEIFRHGALAAISPYMSEALIREALTRVKGMESPLFRDFILADLVPELVRSEQISEVCKRAIAIENPMSQAQALTAIFGQLNSRDRSEIFQQIMDVLLQDDEEALSEQLSRELERLEVGGLVAGLIKSAYSQTSWRVGVIEVLLQWLSDADRQKVSDFVMTWPDSMFKLQAVAVISPYILDERRQIAEQEAIEIATRIGKREKSEWPFITALTSLLIWISEEQRSTIASKAFETVHSAGLWVPAELAPYIPKSDMGKALELTRHISSDARREALDALVPHLPPEFLQTVLDIAWSIGDDKDKVRTMADLGPGLTERMMQVCLDEASKPVSLDTAGDVISDVAAYLPIELLPNALDLARQVGDTIAIARLAKRFQGSKQTALWQEAIALAIAKTDAYLLENLAAELPQHLIVETVDALNDARAKGEMDPLGVAECTSSLLPRLPAPVRSSAMDEILNIISSHWPDQDQYEVRLTGYGASQILGKVAPELGPSRLPQGLGLAKRIPDPYHRATAICALIPFAALPLQNQLILSVAGYMKEFKGNNLQDANSQQEEITSLAIPYLQDKSKALELTRSTSELNCARALEGLAPQLPAELVDQALEIGRSIEGGDYRATALSALAPLLPAEQQGEVWREAFQAALADFSAVYTLCRTPNALIGTDTLSLVTNAMSMLQTQQRWQALRYISGLAPLITTLGEDIARSTFNAIEDVGRWWP
jgi:hypothetical protein